MNRWRLELLMFTAVFVTTATAAHRWFAAPSSPPIARAIPVLGGAQNVGFSPISLRAAAETTVESDPFRLSNTPPAISSTGRGNTARPPAPSRAPRVILVLKAITGGPPWQAVVAGLPGQNGDALVRPGAMFGEVTVESISRDTVYVRSADTAWTLALKRGAP
jgi:hypothetical protein